MTGPRAPWQPRYAISAKTSHNLMRIERSRTLIETLPLAPKVLAELQNEARLRSTHFSTRIEGNRLTLEQAQAVVARPRVQFRGRERDVREVWDYWCALIEVERWAERSRAFSDLLIRETHALRARSPAARSRGSGT